MKIICPYCAGNTNFIEGDRLPKFCFHCRKLLPKKFCKMCGLGAFLNDANFCTACGEKLEATTV